MVIEHPDFDSLTRKNFLASLNSRFTADLTLEVGSTAESVSRRRQSATGRGLLNANPAPQNSAVTSSPNCNAPCANLSQLATLGIINGAGGSRQMQGAPRLPPVPAGSYGSTRNASSTLPGIVPQLP